MANMAKILVLFTLCIVALLGFAGLALDGGSAYAQRRQQQTASDLAALGAANDYLISGDATQATTRAARSPRRTATRTGCPARSWMSRSTPPTASG